MNITYGNILFYYLQAPHSSPHSSPISQFGEYVLAQVQVQKKKFRVLMLYSGKHHQEQVIEVPTRKQYWIIKNNFLNKFPQT